MRRSTGSTSTATPVHLADGSSARTTCWSSPPAPRLVPEETEGLTGPGWMEKVFTFYTPEGAAALEGR